MTVFSTTSPEGETPPDNDALTNLARSLRQGVGQEWRAELEATEFETHQHRLRGRTLGRVVRMLLHRGDQLTIQTGTMQWTGEVAGCGKDYLTLYTEQFCVDARLDRIVLVVTKRSSGGIEAKGLAPTWLARLKELELTEEPVELYGPSLGHSRKGRIRVVSTDHIWLVEKTGLDSYLPTSEIAVAIRRLQIAKSSTGMPV